MIDDNSFLEFLIEAYSNGGLDFNLENELIVQKQSLIKDYLDGLNKHKINKNLSKNLRNVLSVGLLICEYYLEDLDKGLYGIENLYATEIYVKKNELTKS